MGVACDEGLQFPKPVLKAGGIYHMYQCVAKVSVRSGRGEEGRGKEVRCVVWGRRAKVRICGVGVEEGRDGRGGESDVYTFHTV